MLIGADTGGTFSDLVDDGGNVTKVLSTPDAPDDAVRAGVAELTSARPALLAHGTTVATNAVLEGRLARTALITTRGLADVIEIGRQDRPSLYDQFADRPVPLVPRELRFEVAGRRAADGTELEPVDLDALPDLPDDVEAVAVCLLHADLDPSHEQAVARALRERGLDVVASHEVSPEFREYERTVTTVVDAGLRPRCRRYLQRLTDLADEVSVMTSAGGLLDAGTAADLPAALLLSGPAGGVRAAAAVALANGWPDAITFDMGGTSTDVCLVRGGEPAFATTRHVGGYPVRFPSLDIHTIGAGGGSIARIDAGGALVVGPASAGADPGPACYGRGGTAPTVTDANLVAGRIPADASFGRLELDADAAQAVLASAGVDADGILQVVDANMERALRAVSVERGVDPGGLALVAFGGAGALHACSLAEAMDIPVVIVPARAGVLSAVGLLMAPPQREVVRSRRDPGDLATLADDVGAVAATARSLHEGPGPVEVTTAIDCRYVGQSHELTVADLDAFHDEHELRNGFARPDAPVEVVAVRATLLRQPAVDLADLPVPEHRAAFEPVQGSRVIAEPDCTIWLAAGWQADAGAAGALVLRRAVS
ncbi:hydantoinase/oxoprolinase family protein [Acidimicrobiia bacterium EGI L10123]|uniref:hydantoinase/oxoprolinase family protein n=1 Tax=Salinilacustrithrix flava TaxID=2957203 RepID=UPI003D7C2E98|nr:hydantoinase/oxoprolinase family protein [Acidimicrobiia bacterium EGI L10123]